MSTAAVLTALAAAILFGWSTALMHHSASTVPGGARGTVALLKYLVVQWRWLLGMVASLSGLAVHILALGLGSIAVVQPLVVSGLAFSFIFRAGLDRKLLPRRVVFWVVVTTVGLAVFLVTIGDTKGTGAPSNRAVIYMLGIGLAIAAISMLLSLRRPPAESGFLLGVCGGVIFGLIAGTLKAGTYNASHGVALWASWPLYTVVPLGVAGFLTNQRAYHHAPLTVSLPVLNLLNPLVAILFGVVAFHERPSGSAAQMVAGAIGLAAVLAGIFFLARQDEAESEVTTAEPPEPGEEDQDSLLTSASAEPTESSH